MIIPNDNLYSIRSTRLHSCGQVIEELIHLKVDEVFSLNFVVPPFPSLSDYSTESFESYMHEITERRQKIELTGHIDKLEINGMRWKNDTGLTCLHCGADLLFPGKE